VKGEVEKFGFEFYLDNNPSQWIKFHGLKSFSGSPAPFSGSILALS
jgi:hypothetical protein